MNGCQTGEESQKGFPGGPVIKHPPAEARDRDSIPGPGRPTSRGAVLWATVAEAPVPQRPPSTTQEALQ